MGRFETPQKKTTKEGGSKPRMSVGYYKNTENTTEKDIMALLKDETLSEFDIVTKYHETTSPTEIKRNNLYFYAKELGLLKDPEED